MPPNLHFKNVPSTEIIGLQYFHPLIDAPKAIKQNLK
uniref:Uncharacterized protein n=1 Tax=Cucumis melo TaxID=3656 RepID=A0A9I9E9L4_CUCME